MALEWVEELGARRAELGLDVDLVLYRNVRTNNGDLPERAFLHGGGPLPADADALDPARPGAVRRGLPDARDPHRADRVLGDRAAEGRRPLVPDPRRHHARASGPT